MMLNAKHLSSTLIVSDMKIFFKIFSYITNTYVKEGHMAVSRSPESK